MSGPTVSRPLLPVLLRMAAGLLLAALGGVLVWQGSAVNPTPGLGSVSTPFGAPLDGPLPLDVARSATLRFRGEVGELKLRVSALAADSPDVLRGEARHRVRNPLRFGASRRAGTLDATVRLDVRPLDRGGVIVARRATEPLLHHVEAGLTPRIPVTLDTVTGVGDQTLDLRTLRLRALTARTGSGTLSVTLPARPTGPLALISGSGGIAVKAAEVPGQPGASPEALRANARSGALTLDLAGARVGTLSVGSGSGNVRLTLPTHTDRGSVTTGSGNVVVRVPRGGSGNLDIRTQSGRVRLSVPPDLSVRIRFTDRDTLTLPPPRAGQAAPAPGLDVFIDAPASRFTLDSPSP